MAAGGRGSFKIAAGIFLALVFALNTYFVSVNVDLSKYVGAYDIYDALGFDASLDSEEEGVTFQGDGNDESESTDVDVDVNVDVVVVSNAFANGNGTNPNGNGRGNRTNDEDYFNTEEYRKERVKHFHSWYVGNKTKFLLPDADKNGPILDFAIVGQPKCGTTTVEMNLGKYAPMPVADICTPSAQTVYYSYKNWPREFGYNKTMRGTKCPKFTDSNFVKDYSKHLPRTKMIMGIRHPVSWFESFYNMMANSKMTYRIAKNDPYNLMKICTGASCANYCTYKQLVCLGRTRFHLALASLGKTNLTETERKLLAANDKDGGKNLVNFKVRNPLFLYEMNELREDYLWDGMANYLGMKGGIDNDQYGSSPGLHKSPQLRINICDEKFDRLRGMIMPYAYELSVWLQEYFIPLAKDESRPDVTIAQPHLFEELIEKYKSDPCNRLTRLVNGTYSIENASNITATL